MQEVHDPGQFVTTIPALPAHAFGLYEPLLWRGKPRPALGATPMSKNPWDIPPLPEVGDESPSATFEAVGHALTQWERLENGMARLFAILIGGGNETYSARHAFSAVATPRARTEMMKQVADFFFSTLLLESNISGDAKEHLKKMQNCFKKLMDAYSQFGSRRNDIAHGIVEPHWRSGFILTAPHYNLKKRPRAKPMKYGYVSTNIRHFSYEFDNLRQCAFDLADNLDRWRMQFRLTLA